jgi:hypothetical protein
VSAALLQLTPQEVVAPAYEHADALVPSHVPAQGLPPSSALPPRHAARVPCGAPVTVVQVPTLPPTSHAWHCPVHPVLQHTPSTQTPLAHWPFVSHEVPLAAVVPHVPRLHVAGDAQSVFVAQVVTQLPFSHAYGAQLMDEGRHVPAPLQRDVVVSLPEHVGLPHAVPAGDRVWHAPAPLHWPSPMHESGAGVGQKSCGSVPASTGAQRPLPGVPPSAKGCWRAAEHVSHPGQLEAPQQTPLSQKFEVHSRQPGTRQSPPAVVLHVEPAPSCGWHVLVEAQ